MPIKGGRLTPHERLFTKHMAATGDKKYSGTQAGLAFPLQSADKMLKRPAVIAEIRRQQEEKLYSELLPASIKCLGEIIGDPKAPAGARVQASKVVLDRTLGANDGGNTKEPHEMTPDEIAEAIAKLEDAAAAQARPIHRNVTIEQPNADVFE